MKKYYSSIILAIIGIFILFLLYQSNRGGSGLGFIIFIGFFTILYFLILIGLTIGSLIKKSKGNIPFNFLPIWTTVLFFAFSILLLNIDKFKSPTVMFAITNPTVTREGTYLRLRKNNSFEIREDAIESFQIFSGTYSLNKDTLTLIENSIAPIRDGTFSNKYLIDEQNKFLYPIKNNSVLKDSVLWLIITTNKN